MSIRQGNNIIAGSSSISSSHMVGELVAFPISTEFTPEGFIKPDGTEFTQGLFPDLWESYLHPIAIGEKRVTILDVCTYEEYANEVNTYGACAKWAVDDVRKTFKVPLIPDSRLSWKQYKKLGVKGNGIALGLKGQAYAGLAENQGGSVAQLAALYNKPIGTNFGNLPYTSNVPFKAMGVTDDSSKSGIEADLDNAQYNDIEVQWFIYVANAQVGQSTIDWVECIEKINNNLGGFSLFDTKISDHELKGSEIKGWAMQGATVPRSLYPDFYDVCLQEYNNAIDYQVGIIEDFIQPKLSSNGAMGGDHFAVTGNCANPYLAFDGNQGTAAGSTGLREFTMYNPTAIKIQRLTVWNESAAANFPSRAEIRGSNDGRTWDFIGAYTQGANAVWNIDINTDKSYKYFKYNCTANHGGNSNWYKEFKITGKVVNLVDGCKQYANGHIYYTADKKPQIDKILNDFGIADYYGIDIANKEIILPRNNQFIKFTQDLEQLGKIDMTLAKGQNNFASHKLLYYCVGNTVLNKSSIDTAGIAGELIKKAYKTEVPNLAMPSDKSVDIAVGPSDTAYTAPANGYFMVDTFCGDNKYFILINEKNGERVIGVNVGSLDSSGVISATKGDKVKLHYVGSWAPHTWQKHPFRFIYAEGSK